MDSKMSSNYPIVSNFRALDSHPERASEGVNECVLIVAPSNPRNLPFLSGRSQKSKLWEPKG